NDQQFDTVTDALIHIDLLELVDDKKVIAAIPLHFSGSAKGVKDGGKLHIKMKSVKVKTFPKYLREQIEINVDNLELNGSIRVEDVKIENYEILNSPRIPVASVTLTRELKQEEAATPAATATAAAAPAGATAPVAATAPAEKAEKREKGKK
ncbi:MAG TPA: 50S ribosomal protein L25, partial [Chitinophagaceae bacterium]|nr:50S ribosomal protein L25 [Chitinophagaceae bacterium]